MVLCGVRPVDVVRRCAADQCADVQHASHVRAVDRDHRGYGRDWPACSRKTEAAIRIWAPHSLTACRASKP